jgi:TatD DNase family protein
VIDTHAHIYLDKFSEDRDEMISRFRKVGGKRIYLPNIDVESIPSLKELSSTFPDICYPMMGLHPCSVEENYLEQLAIIKNELSQGNYAAVGEIGIDHYWDKTFIAEQEIAFRTQIEWARTLQLPIVIHSRDTLDLTISIVAELQKGDLTGIFHCFNGTLEQAQKIIDLGFYMGIGGIATYKNAGVDKVVAEIALDYLVLETDAPYLSPVPFRGKRNEPSFVLHVAEKLSEIKKIPLEEVIDRTSENAVSIFPKLEMAT